MRSNDPDDPLPIGPLQPEWEHPAPDEWLAPDPLVECWRCGRAGSPIAGRCPWCSARLAVAAPDHSSARFDRRAERSNPLGIVLFAYGLFLLTSVVWGWVLLARGAGMREDELQTGTAVVETIDTVVVLVALAAVGRLALPDPPARARAAAWACAVPVLILLICANLLYGAVLREIIRPPAFLTPESPKLTPLAVLLICLQPAIIEELFFRYLALGALHRATGAATAVWVSAVMFAVAHLYNPLGMPYLFVAGVVFGYARVYGGLLLPMILHFLHNLAVLAIEVAK